MQKKKRETERESKNKAGHLKYLCELQFSDCRIC